MSFRTALSDRRLWVMAAYGFACGLPLPLTGFTLRQWMSEGGVTLGTIGLSAYIGLSYTLKFLWSPLLDQMRPPFARLGRRRGWLAAVQPLLSVACLLFALSDPSAAPVAAVAAAMCVAFLSASSARRRYGDLCVGLSLRHAHLRRRSDSPGEHAGVAWVVGVHGPVEHPADRRHCVDPGTAGTRWDGPPGWTVL
jgi:MFS family permease